MARIADLQLHAAPADYDLPAFVVVAVDAERVRFTGASPRKDGALDLSALLRCLREVAALCAEHRVERLRLRADDFTPLDPNLLSVVAAQLMPTIAVEVTPPLSTAPVPGATRPQEDTAHPAG